MKNDTATIYTHRGIARSVELVAANKDFSRQVQDFAIIIDGLFRFMEWPDDKWSFVNTVEKPLAGTVKYVPASASTQFIVSNRVVRCCLEIGVDHKTQVVVAIQAESAPSDYSSKDPMTITLAHLPPMVMSVSSTPSLVAFYEVASGMIRDGLCATALVRHS